MRNIGSELLRLTRVGVSRLSLRVVKDLFLFVFRVLRGKVLPKNLLTSLRRRPTKEFPIASSFTNQGSSGPRKSTQPFRLAPQIQLGRN